MVFSLETSSSRYSSSVTIHRIGGTPSLVGNIGVRAQVKKLGGWWGFDFSSSGSIPLPFSVRTLTKDISIPIPKPCECMNHDIDGTSALSGLLAILGN